jgi:uncharacterized membrane protein YraQ (UPF0718 family)
MPLGVCANCVAPIGRGLYASGMSTESTLAAMFSSPTLNVVVLAMAFALFPLPIVGLKLATMLLMIFVFAPLVGARRAAPAIAGECAIEVPGSATWAQAVETVAKSYAKSFWHIARVGVPLMVLAAVLGALAIETIPQQGLHAPATLGGIALVAVVGTFLPVPMAFDVVIAYLAMSRGVALPYVVTILCTLGIYSVYSFLVVGKTISWKIAAAAGGRWQRWGRSRGLRRWRCGKRKRKTSESLAALACWAEAQPLQRDAPKRARTTPAKQQGRGNPARRGTLRYEEKPVRRASSC